MNIAIIGYGKMGHAVERILQERGHRVTCRIDADNADELHGPTLAASDVAIEFSRPEAAVGNILAATQQGVPVVSGTTGWTGRRAEVEEALKANGGSLLWASNFSIGVYLFRLINKAAARLMSFFPQYTPRMEEIHHVHKLDHPSGTAITLAETLCQEAPRLKGWTEDASAASREGKIAVECRRQGEVPGTHIVAWDSPQDAITLEHRAKGRDGFALGAVLAAEWLARHPGPGLRTLDEMFDELLDK